MTHKHYISRAEGIWPASSTSTPLQIQLHKSTGKHSSTDIHCNIHYLHRNSLIIFCFKALRYCFGTKIYKSTNPLNSSASAAQSLQTCAPDPVFRPISNYASTSPVCFITPSICPITTTHNRALLYRLIYY